MMDYLAKKLLTWGVMFSAVGATILIIMTTVFGFRFQDARDAFEGYGDALTHFGSSNEDPEVLPEVVEEEELEEWKPEKGTLEERFPLSAVHDIKADLRGGSLILQVNPDIKEIRVVSDEKYDGWEAFLKEDDGEKELVIRTEEDDSTENIVYLFVPEDHHFHDAEFEAGIMLSQDTKNQLVFFLDGLRADKLEVSALTGGVFVQNVKMDELEADLKDGMMEIHGNVKKKAEVQTDGGEMKLFLKGREKDFDYEISAEHGRLTLAGEVYENLMEETKISNKADKKAELECNAGVMEVNFEK